MIIQGDSLAVLKTLPDESVDCVITSPPYYGLRDYGNDKQLGLEKTLDEYLNRLLAITAECKRVLKKTGTLWINHGDSYGNNGGEQKGRKNRPNQNERYEITRPQSGTSKSLLMTPYRLALKMTNEQGWILRNVLIWFKPNCMPSSVKDRFTVDYEPVFFFTKSKKYYFKQLFEDCITGNGREQGIAKGKRFGGTGQATSCVSGFGERVLKNGEQGRNKRCVWKISTKPYKEAHFAVFPEDLVEPMIESGCPPKGVVLDPFCGSGTTGVVAKKLGRDFIGIELNPEYIRLAEKRIMEVPVPLFDLCGVS
jgi:DNA modification methylase